MISGKKKSGFKLVILVVIIVTGIVTCINPIYPQEQLLQHSGTLVLLTVLFMDLRKSRATLFAFAFFAGYIFLHIIGARYIYSYVPYNKWYGAVIGLFTDTPVIIAESRNGYDRFVHFAYGILLFPYIYEVFGFKRTIDKRMLIILVWAFMQSVSMVYEIFEWGLTLALSPEAANDYNGQQGDMWDAQKDMFLAMLGSTIMAGIYLLSPVAEFLKRKDKIGLD